MRSEIIPSTALSAMGPASLDLEASLALVLPLGGDAEGPEAARRVLPIVLAALTGQSPAAIRIQKDAQGKPGLVGMERTAPQHRQQAFSRYWVRKEAVLKAAGSGFLRDPREVNTGFEEQHPKWVGVAGPRFFIHDQFIATSCFAAVASMDASCRWHLLEA